MDFSGCLASVAGRAIDAIRWREASPEHWGKVSWSEFSKADWEPLAAMDFFNRDWITGLLETGYPRY